MASHVLPTLLSPYLCFCSVSSPEKVRFTPWTPLPTHNPATHWRRTKSGPITFWNPPGHRGPDGRQPPPWLPEKRWGGEVGEAGQSVGWALLQETGQPRCHQGLGASRGVAACCPSRPGFRGWGWMWGSNSTSWYLFYLDTSEVIGGSLRLVGRALLECGGCSLDSVLKAHIQLHILPSCRLTIMDSQTPSQWEVMEAREALVPLCPLTSHCIGRGLIEAAPLAQACCGHPSFWPWARGSPMACPPPHTVPRKSRP